MTTRLTGRPAQQSLVQCYVCDHNHKVDLMKRAAVAGAVVAAAGLMLVVGTTGGAARSRPDAETLRYTFRMPVTTPHGPRAGDIHTFSGTLHRGTRIAGSYRGVCVVTDPGPAALQCNATAHISGRGQVDAVGDVGPGGRGVMTVVGGTRDFRDVSGTRTGRNPRREGNVLVAELEYRVRR